MPCLPEEALAQIRVAAKLDPMAPVIQETVAELAWSVIRGRLHSYRGEWDAAIATLGPRIERFPGRRTLTRFLVDLIARQGDIELARSLMVDAFSELLENGRELTPTDLGDTACDRQWDS